jgi:purine nucleosidase
VVFDAPWAVTMVPLELTHQATATPDVLARIAAVGTAPARLTVELLEFFSSTYLAVEGMPAPPVHDPCAVARVIDPSAVAVRPAHVAVELAGTHTAGATVTDFRSPTRSGAPHNASVATELDRDRFWGLVVGALEAIGEPAG